MAPKTRGTKSRGTRGSINDMARRRPLLRGRVPGAANLTVPRVVSERGLEFVSYILYARDKTDTSECPECALGQLLPVMFRHLPTIHPTSVDFNIFCTQHGYSQRDAEDDELSLVLPSGTIISLSTKDKWTQALYALQHEIQRQVAPKKDPDAVRVRIGPRNALLHYDPSLTDAGVLPGTVPDGNTGEDDRTNYRTDDNEYEDQEPRGFGWVLYKLIKDDTVVSRGNLCESSLLKYWSASTEITPWMTSLETFLKANREFLSEYQDVCLSIQLPRGGDELPYIVDEGSWLVAMQQVEITIFDKIRHPRGATSPEDLELSIKIIQAQPGDDESADDESEDAESVDAELVDDESVDAESERECLFPGGDETGGEQAGYNSSSDDLEGGHGQPESAANMLLGFAHGDSRSEATVAEIDNSNSFLPPTPPTTSLPAPSGTGTLDEELQADVAYQADIEDEQPGRGRQGTRRRGRDGGLHRYQPIPVPPGAYRE